MSRVKGGMTTRRKHKSILKQVKGHRGASRTRIRAAKESLTHAQTILQSIDISKKDL